MFWNMVNIFFFFEQHYNIELKDNSVDMTEEGVALAEMALETNDLWDENDPWARCYATSSFAIIVLVLFSQLL